MNKHAEEKTNRFRQARSEAQSLQAFLSSVNGVASLATSSNRVSPQNTLRKRRDENSACVFSFFFSFYWVLPLFPALAMQRFVTMGINKTWNGKEAEVLPCWRCCLVGQPTLIIRNSLNTERGNIFIQEKKL